MINEENMKNPTFLIDQIIDVIETWLVSGKLNSDVLSDDFQFSSPFWRDANKTEFIKQFGDASSYQETALSKINYFDPVIKLKDADEKHFAIVLQYHTKNDSHVYETVFGTVKNGSLAELRSIYDLNETKKSLEIN